MQKLLIVNMYGILDKKEKKCVVKALICLLGEHTSIRDFPGGRLV